MMLRFLVCLFDLFRITLWQRNVPGRKKENRVKSSSGVNKGSSRKEVKKSHARINDTLFYRASFQWDIVVTKGGLVRNLILKCLSIDMTTLSTNIDDGRHSANDVSLWITANLPVAGLVCWLLWDSDLLSGVHNDNICQYRLVAINMGMRRAGILSHWTSRLLQHDVLGRTK